MIDKTLRQCNSSWSELIPLLCMQSQDYICQLNRSPPLHSCLVADSKSELSRVMQK